MVQKVSYPEPVEKAIKDYTSILDEGGFFNDEVEFPPNMQEIAKAHLWNFLGETLMPKFIEGSGNYLASNEEMGTVLVNTIIQTNLDSLMEEKFIDGIEDENGETIYWLTDKGKEEAAKDDSE